MGRERIRARAFEHSCSKVTISLLKSFSVAAAKGKCPACTEVGRPSGALARPRRPLSFYS